MYERHSTYAIQKSRVWGRIKNDLEVLERPLDISLRRFYERSRIVYRYRLDKRSRFTSKHRANNDGGLTFSADREARSTAWSADSLPRDIFIGPAAFSDASRRVVSHRVA